MSWRGARFERWLAPARAPSQAAEDLRATIRGQLDQGFSTRTIAAKLGIGETSVRDINTGRRGVSEAKAKAALRSFVENSSDMHGFPVSGGGFRVVEPRTRREASRIGKYLNALGQAQKTGDYRLVRKIMRGKETIIGPGGETVRLETGPRRLREAARRGPLELSQRQIRIPKKINAPAGATMTAHRGNICPLCGQASPSPMTMRGCCQACASGHVTERHHIWWKDNSPAVVEIPTNWHAVFNARWSERCAVLKRPGADPLHRGAAAARTVGEAAAALAEFAKAHGWPAWVATLAATFAEGMSSLANWLLLIAGRLDAAFGPDWAAKLGVPPWSPPEAP